MTARPVLPRQQAAAIRSSVELRGYPPTVREIAEAIGVTSTSTALSHLRELAFKGYIRRDEGKPRAIVILP